jgi:hypothetical protein
MRKFLIFTCHIKQCGCIMSKTVVFSDVTPCILVDRISILEELNASNYQTAWCHILEHHNLICTMNCCENLKSLYGSVVSGSSSCSGDPWFNFFFSSMLSISVYISSFSISAFVYDPSFGLCLSFHLPVHYLSDIIILCALTGIFVLFVCNISIPLYP